MENNKKEKPLKKNATILLVSGDLDKAFAAFETAAAMTAMGIQVDMWFVFYGINGLKKTKSFIQRFKYLYKAMREAPGRNLKTDILPQRLIPFLNAPTSNSLPLSQLNIFGIGRLLINFIMLHKGFPLLKDVIKEAETLGVNFKICQPCVDVLMLDIEEDLIVKAQSLGASSYVVDLMKSHVNLTF